jgi:hypothetical protein
MQRRWDKAGDDESHAFFNPDADDAQDTGGNSHASSLKGVGHEKQCRPGEVAGNRGPNPGHEAVVTMAAEEKILRGRPVGSACVEQREQLACQHDQINSHRNSNDLNQRAGWPGGAAYPVVIRRIRITSMINAGPLTNAEARNRGASNAVFQKGRPPRPQYRNAVTV